MMIGLRVLYNIYLHVWHRKVFKLSSISGCAGQTMLFHCLRNLLFLHSSLDFRFCNQYFALENELSVGHSLIVLLDVPLVRLMFGNKFCGIFLNYKFGVEILIIHQLNRNRRLESQFSFAL